MRRDLAVLVILLAFAALGRILGVGVCFDPKGGPTTVEGLSLATTWEQTLARVGPPTLSSPGDAYVHWPQIGLEGRFEEGRAVAWRGQRLEQGGRLLLQSGDTTSQIRAVLGSPARAEGNLWTYQEPPLRLTIEDGHLSQLCLGQP